MSRRVRCFLPPKETAPARGLKALGPVVSVRFSMPGGRSGTNPEPRSPKRVPIKSRRGAIFLVGATGGDLQRIVSERKLQRAGRISPPGPRKRGPMTGSGVICHFVFSRTADYAVANPPCALFLSPVALQGSSAPN